MQLKGEPGIENSPNEAGGYFAAWASNGQKGEQWKYLKLKKWDNKYGVEIKLKNSICNKTIKKRLGHNLKTQNVMQLKNSSCETKQLKCSQNLNYGTNQRVRNWQNLKSWVKFSQTET